MNLWILWCGLYTTYANSLVSEYHAANIKFAANVYKMLSSSTSKNIVVCPLTVQVGLAMVYIGASGETAKQLSVASNIPNQSNQVVDMFSGIVPMLETNNNYTFMSASKIYVKGAFKIHQDYTDTVTNKFKSEIETIDFNKANAVATINTWAKDKTQNKITRLVKQDELDDDLRLMILNAIYFKGEWVDEFRKSKTVIKPYYLNNTHFVNTEMMSNKKLYNYYEDEMLKVKFLELPFKGNDVSMTIALPNDPEDIKALESNIESVLELKFEHQTTVNVRIPKFRVTGEVKFKKMLRSFGAVLPFADDADFTKMIVSKTNNLKIAELIQKATIEVDEKGSTSAAVSAVHVFGWKSITKIPPVYFCADHPFIYYIRHKTAGIICIGRYSVPRGRIKTKVYEETVNHRLTEIFKLK